MFIGLVNYYQYMWENFPHTLHPPNILTSNEVNFNWTSIEQKTFDEVKEIVAHKTLLAYPDFNKQLDI